MHTNKPLRELPVDNHFRLRGHEGTQMDGFTDGIFALAVAILLISSSVPSNYEELLSFIYDLIPFTICIIFIFWIWRALTIFNRRFGLEDSKTIQMKMALMLFTIFYVYPLKFLMAWQVKYFSVLINGNFASRYDELQKMIPFEKLPHLMRIYGVGFFLVFGILYMLNRQAWKRREVLQLNNREKLETRYPMRRYAAFALVGLFSVLIAQISIWLQLSLGAIFAGISYNLIWIIVLIEARWYRKRVTELERDE